MALRPSTDSLRRFERKTSKDNKSLEEALFCARDPQLMVEWLNGSPRTFAPPSHFWTVELAIRVVSTDARCISDLPSSLSRVKGVRRQALLQLLGVGIPATCFSGNQPFLGLLSRDRKGLQAGWPKALPLPTLNRSAFWWLLGERSEDLRNLLALDGRNIAYFPSKLKDCGFYAKAALNSDAALCGIRHLSAQFRDCPIFMAYAIRKRPSAYMHCSKRLRCGDYFLFHRALSKGFHRALFCTHPPLRLDHSLGVAAVWATGGLGGIPSKLRKDPRYLCQLAPSCGSLMLRGMDSLLLENKDFLIKLLRARPEMSSALIKRDVALPIEPPTCRLPYVECALEPQDLWIRVKRARYLDILECPICKDTVRGTVQQCRLGHTFCSECIARMPGGVEFVCPVCRIRQSRFVLARSLLSEKFVELLEDDALTRDGST